MGYSGNGTGNNGVGGNGHANGSQNGSTPIGGNGGPLAEPGRHERSDVRDLVRSAVKGWLGAESLKWAYDALKDVANTSHDGRARVAAAEGVIRMAELGFRLDESDDKRRRLDTGQATENHAHYSVSIPEARSRISE